MRRALLRELNHRVEAWSPVFRSTVAVRTAKPVVVLTFDDGPTSDCTPGILDVLAERGAHATFFVLMRRVRAAPELVQRMVADGHDVALHGEDHRRLTQFPSRTVTRTLQAARDELEAHTGGPVRWFRPPYGAQTPLTSRAIRRAGLRSVLWSASLLDGRDATQEERLAHATRGVAAGAILLAHDGQADARDGVADPPVVHFDRAHLLRAVLDAHAERGLQGTSLSRALADGTERRLMRLRR